MKTALLILICLTVPSLSFSQSLQVQNPRPQSEGPSLPQRQIVDLPLVKRGFRPRLTLQQALKIGERYIKVQRLDLSSYYLLEAKFILYGGDAKDPRWFFVWLNSGEAGKTHGVDFQLRVSMDGKVGVVPSM